MENTNGVGSCKGCGKPLELESGKPVVACVVFDDGALEVRYAYHGRECFNMNPPDDA